MQQAHLISIVLASTVSADPLPALRKLLQFVLRTCKTHVV